MDSDSLGIHVDWIKTQLRFIITAFHKAQLKSTQLSQQSQWIQLKSDSLLKSWVQNSSGFLFCELVQFVNLNRFAHHCLEDQVHPTVCVSVTHLSAPYFPCVDVGYLAYRYWEFENYSKNAWSMMTINHSFTSSYGSLAQNWACVFCIAAMWKEDLCLLCLKLGLTDFWRVLCHAVFRF